VTPARRSRVRHLLAALVVVACAFAPAAYARTSQEDLPAVSLPDLPKEARAVDAKIRSGGFFRYGRDGAVFGNRERVLPAKPHGYYHEYTVPTPGAEDRGARRIVCGGPKTAPETCYYTDDHYRTFRRIRE
jgi:ribonuclease T1